MADVVSFTDFVIAWVANYIGWVIAFAIVYGVATGHMMSQKGYPYSHGFWTGACFGLIGLLWAGFLPDKNLLGKLDDLIALTRANNVIANRAAGGAPTAPGGGRADYGEIKQALQARVEEPKKAKGPGQEPIRINVKTGDDGEAGTPVRVCKQCGHARAWEAERCPECGAEAFSVRYLGINV